MKFELIAKWLPGVLIVNRYEPKEGSGMFYHDEFFIRAADLEAELRKGVEVFGRIDGDFGWTGCKRLPTETQPWSERTHHALLIGQRPIVKDTAESLLREIRQLYAGSDTDTVIDQLGAILDRAKALEASNGRPK